jgi:hypothetical protein
MSDTIAEGHFVRHRTEQFVGVHAGVTRMAHLMERPGDATAVRVRLPDGSIKVAAERSLERVGPAEFAAYAAQTGVAMTERQVLSAGRA